MNNRKSVSLRTKINDSLNESDVNGKCQARLSESGADRGEILPICR